MYESLDVQVVMNQVLDEMNESGALKRLLQEQMERTMKSVFEHMFSSYSDFSKQIESAVKESLKVDTEKLNLPTYNTLVAQVVREKLDELVRVQGVEKLQQQLDEMLTNVKETYSLQEIIDEMKREENEYLTCSSSGERITLNIDSHARSLTFIRFDPAVGVEKYRCKYGITVDTEDGRIHSVDIEGKKMDSNAMMGGFHGVAKILFQMYATNAKLTDFDDEDEINLYYDDEYED